MLTYRSLTEDDCGFIMQNWVGRSSIFAPGLSLNELSEMIRAWDTKEFNGSYYEMFGVENGDTLIGTFSFYQRDSDISENALYLGVEIDTANRSKGFATETVLMSFQIARDRGFDKIFSQARLENIASVRLHKKCGFDIIEKTLSKRGYEVYNYVKIL